MPQFGQRDRGATIDSPSGTRWATTLRKLPAISPSRAMKTISAATDALSVRVGAFLQIGGQPIGVVVSTSRRLSKRTVSYWNWNWFDAPPCLSRPITTPIRL